MISNADITRWHERIAHIDDVLPDPTSRGIIRRLLAERELLVAEHRAGTLIRDDPDYNYLTPEFQAHDVAWQAVEDFK